MISRELVTFLSLTFVLAFATQLMAIRAGIPGKGAGPWLWLTMWCPAVSALLTSRGSREAVRDAVRRIAWKWIPLGMLVGLGPTLVANAWLAVTKTGHWNSEQFVILPDGRIAMPTLASFVAGLPLTPTLFVLNLVGTLAFAATVFGVVDGAGEEIGWRAVLQPELERRFGRTRGVLILGIVWAYWHLPVNLAGYNDRTHAVANALVFFPVAVVMMAFSFGWLRRSSRSVWPAATAHSANNAINSGFLMKENSWTAGVVAELVGMGVVGALFVY